MFNDGIENEFEQAHQKGLNRGFLNIRFLFLYIYVRHKTKQTYLYVLDIHIDTVIQG